MSIITCLYHPTAKRFHGEMAMARRATAICTGNNMLATLHPEEIIQRTITIKRIRNARRRLRHDPCLVIDGFKRAMAIARLVFDTYRRNEYWPSALREVM